MSEATATVKGVCGDCHANVMSDQERTKDSHGVYRHKKCPSQIRSTKHDCALSLRDPNRCGWRCNICRDRFTRNQLGYRCGEHDWDICMTCLEKEKTVKKPEKKTIAQPTFKSEKHKHPLTQTPEVVKRRCDVCRVKKSQTLFSCKACDFELCLTCKRKEEESPPSSGTTLQSKKHKHPLTKFKGLDGATCDVCSKDCGDKCYSCEACNFDLCHKCKKAEEKPTTESAVTFTSKKHKHPLTKCKCRDAAKCDVCSKDCGDKCYSCAKCDFDLCHKCKKAEETPESPGWAVVTPVAPTPAPVSSTPDEGREVPAACKLQVKQNKALISNFGKEYGEEAADLLGWLQERSTLEDPRAKPPPGANPWMHCWEEVWEEGKPGRDEGGEECLKELAKIMRKKQPGKLFVDPYFPPDNSSLFVDPGMAGANAECKQTDRKDQDAFLSSITNIEWKRPIDFCKTGQKPVVFSGDVSPEDISQGCLGNCYFLAALATCAGDKSKSLIKDICIDDHGDIGMYGIKFFIHGKWNTVVVDDMFPCMQHGSLGWSPIFSEQQKHSGQGQNEYEFWCMLFEKAFAKLHSCYEATIAGDCGDATNYLTGGSYTSLKWGRERGGDAKQDEVWDAITSRLKQGNYVSASGVTDRDGPGSAKAIGLMTGHAYSVLQAVKVDSRVKLVHVRNPWGHKEWKGAYSDDDKAWTPELRKKCGNSKIADDGSFFMTIEDFYKWYGKVYLCNPHNVAMYSEGKEARLDCFSCCWVSQKTAGGMYHRKSETFMYNPSCELTVSSDCNVEIVVYNRDDRCFEHAKGIKPENIEQRVYLWLLDASDKSAVPKNIMQLWGWQRCETTCLSLEAGRTYHVTLSTWAPGVTGMCWLSVSGIGARLKPRKFAQPTKEDAAIMNDKGLPANKLLCVSCKIDPTSYYSSVAGPTCKSCWDKRKSK